MKDRDLLKAMADIKDEYILEAAPDNLPELSENAPDRFKKGSRKPPLWKRPGFRTAAALAAACFVVLVGVGTWQLSNNGMKQNMQPEHGAAKNQEIAGRADEAMEKAEEADGAIEIADEAGEAMQPELGPAFAMQGGAGEALQELRNQYECLSADKEEKAEMLHEPEQSAGELSGIEPELMSEEETESVTETVTEAASEAAADPAESGKKKQR